MWNKVSETNQLSVKIDFPVFQSNKLVSPWMSTSKKFPMSAEIIQWVLNSRNAMMR